MDSRADRPEDSLAGFSSPAQDARALDAPYGPRSLGAATDAGAEPARSAAPTSAPIEHGPPSAAQHDSTASAQPASRPPVDAITGSVIARKHHDAPTHEWHVGGAAGLVEHAAGASGAPLPAAAEGKFGSSLDAELGGVRVHTGAESAAAADALGARAYTIGQDIHFGAGQYQPSSASGEHLLAHEVAHTVQQAGGAARVVQPKLEVSAPGDSFEVEADRAADAMVAGAPAQVTPASGPVMRDPLPAAQGPAQATATAAAAPAPAKAPRALAHETLAALETALATLQAISPTSADGLAEARSLASRTEAVIRQGVDAARAQLAAAVRDAAATEPAALGDVDGMARRVDEIAAARATEVARIGVEIARVAGAAQADRAAVSPAGLALSDAEVEAAPAPVWGAEHVAPPPPAAKAEAPAEASPHVDPWDPYQTAGDLAMTNGQITGATGSASTTQEIGFGMQTTKKSELAVNTDGTWKSTNTVGMGARPDGENATESVEGSLTFGRGADGAEVMVGGKGVVPVARDGQVGADTMTLSGGLQGGALVVNGGMESERKGEKRTSTAGLGGNVKLGADTASIGATMKLGDKPNEGAGGSADSAGGAIDLAKGTVSGNLSHTETAADGTQNTYGGSATLGQDGGSIAGNVGVGTKTVAVAGSGSASYHVTLNQPVQRADGTWIVTYTRTGSIGGALGAQGGDVAAGATAGGSIDASGTRTGHGERVFTDADPAKAKQAAADFYAKGELGPTEVPTDADAAFALADGQSAGSGSAVTVGGALTGGLGGVGVSLGGSVTAQQDTQVERVGDALIVTVSAAQIAGWKASFGSLASLAYSSSATDSTSHRVQFENSPAGHAAYAAFMKNPNGALPPGGWTELDATKGHVDSHQTSIGMLGLIDAHAGGSTGTSTTVNADGSTAVTQTGTDAGGVSIPLIGSLQTENTLTQRTVGGHTNYSTHSTVEASSADDASVAISAATGTNLTITGGAGSGKWSIDASLADAQIEKFLAAVAAGQVHGGLHPAPLQALQAALAAAGGDHGKRRAALAQFASDGGTDALAQIRAFGGATPTYTLGLEGDTVFIGERGEAALQRTIAGYRQRATDPAADKQALATEIGQALSAQRARANTLGRRGMYPEVPDVLRAEQAARIDEAVATLTTLFSEAQVAAAHQPVAAHDPAAPAAPSASPAHASPFAPPTPVPTDPLLAKLREDQAYLAEMRQAARQSYAEAQRTKGVHDTVRSVYVGASIRDEFGPGIFYDGAEAGHYRTADAKLHEGEVALSRAHTFDDATTRGTVAQQRDNIQAAAVAYSDAIVALDEASAEYMGIERRHPEAMGRLVTH